jgi:MEMO1 family protein
MGSASVRPPAVAGLFYPGDPQRLRAQVTELLADAAHARSPHEPVAASAQTGDMRVDPDIAAAHPGYDYVKALIAPHAGYIYSGAIAGVSFARLRERASDIARVVVIGPAHYVALRGIGIPTAESFATPLGAVALDGDALAVIADLPCVVPHDAAHAPEHALEVELPFLQMMLGEFKLVPLIVGDAEPKEVAQTLSRVWGGAETLIVISSDLSHYHDYDTAKRLDAATAAAIEQGEWARLSSNNACGYLPIAGFLIEAGQYGLQAHRLAMCNSGDTAGDRDRVVGYGAWAF